MSTYVPAFKGYITDVPEMWFKRCDGEVFHFDELTQASVTPNTQFTEVNAGWSLYPVAYLPGQSTMEMQFTSGQFHADMFLMANNVKNGYKPNTEATTLPVTEYVVVTASEVTNVNKITLAQKAAPGSVQIRGYTIKAGNAPTQESDIEPNHGISVTVSPQDGDEYTEVYVLGGTLNNQGDYNGDFKVGDTVDVTYEVSYAAGQVKEIKIDNRSTAMGEVICKWPVYGSSDVCSDSAIRGYVLMTIYKARVTAAPGFDTSYKSAA